MHITHTTITSLCESYLINLKLCYPYFCARRVSINLSNVGQLNHGNVVDFTNLLLYFLKILLIHDFITTVGSLSSSCVNCCSTNCLVYINMKSLVPNFNFHYPVTFNYINLFYIYPSA